MIASNWYAAYLIYFLEDLASAEVLGTVRVQEDLVLLYGDSSEHAYSKAVDMGNQVGQFGRDLLQDSLDALRSIGLGSHSENIVHPSLRETFTDFQFAGLGDLVPLSGPPADGVEIDLNHREFRSEAFEEPSGKAQDWLAFSPLGPAYQDDPAERQLASLYARYHWYLAEQVFSVSSGHLNDSTIVKILYRLVLVEANGPQAAFERAELDASLWPGLNNINCKYVSLRQLSLVQDSLREFCELRSVVVSKPYPAGGSLVRDVNSTTAAKVARRDAVEF